MLFENVFQCSFEEVREELRCDLMLFENVFQSIVVHGRVKVRCDLMLFENVFQYWPRLGLY